MKKQLTASEMAKRGHRNTRKRLGEEAYRLEMKRRSHMQKSYIQKHLSGQKVIPT